MNPGPTMVCGAPWAYAFLCFVVQTLLHEGGHALAAKLVGFRVKAISLGPMLYELGKGFRFERSAYLGRCLVQLTGDSRLYGRMALFAAAGPAANFFSVVPVLVLYSFIGPSPGLDAAATIFVAMGLLLGLASLIPSQKQLASDGLILLGILRRDPIALGHWALVAVSAVAQRGGRVGEAGITKEFLAPLLPREPVVARAHFVATMLALDASDDPAAEALLAAAASYPWDGLKPGAKPAPPIGPSRQVLCADLLLHASAFQALKKAAPVPARELLNKTHALYARLKINADPVLIAEAAVLVAEGREAEAREVLARWETALKPMKPVLQSCHRMFSRWIVEGVAARLAQATEAAAAG